MARISDKHGLTNRYREAGIGKRTVRRGRPRIYLLGTPKKRSRKKTSYRSNIYNNAYQKTNVTNSSTTTAVGCAFAILIGFVAFIIFIIILGTSIGTGNISDIENENQITTLSDTETLPPQTIDISAYSEKSEIAATIDIEKEIDSHLMETAVVLRNNSSKDIKTVVLYLVHCYGEDTPMESWQYNDKLTLKDIPSNTSKKAEWTLGTTTYGKKTFVGYIGYIQYTDGTEWGLSEIDHQKIVTRNEIVPVSFNEVEKHSWRQ